MVQARDNQARFLNINMLDKVHISISTVTNLNLDLQKISSLHRDNLLSFCL